MRKAKRFISSAISFVITAAAVVALLAINGTLPKLINKFENALEYSRAFSTSLGDGEIFIHVIDVGQGDAILIQSCDGNILVDTGTNDSENELVAHLRACGVKAVDYLICSHPHSDHIGGADAVLDNFEVSAIIIPYVEEINLDIESMLLEMKSGNVPNIIHPERGDTFSLGDISFIALTPIDNVEDENDMSLVMKLTFGETSFLLTGDISEDIERALVDTYQDGELDCDFLKIAHHGSNTSTCAQFIDAVTPIVSVVSSGEYNDFGHPRHEVLERLRSGGCTEIYRTDKMSSIILRSDGKKITLVATRDGLSE